MEFTTKQDIEQSVINGKVFDKATNYETHFDIHVLPSQIERLCRVLNNVKADSTFTSEEDAKMFIEETMLFRATEINNWRNTDAAPKTQEFNVYFDEDDGYDEVGTGFIYNHDDNTIKEYKTRAMTLVLRKDPEAELGFNILTAYPDMSDPNIEQTHKDLQPLVKETTKYKNADKLGKIYLECRTNPDINTLMTYKQGYTPDDSMIMIHIPNTASNTTHFIKFKNEQCTLHTTDDSTHEKIATKYTQMQNTNAPKYLLTNTKNVNLKTAPTIMNELTKDNPSVKPIVDTLYKILYSDNNQPAPSQPTHESRVAQAENLSSDVKTEDTISTQKGE